jgi:hypothetical protein
MVLVSEAAARPTHVGHLERAQRLNYVAADTADVRDRRIHPDPDPAIDAVAELLGELAEDVATDRRAGSFGVDDYRVSRNDG